MEIEIGDLVRVNESNDKKLFNLGIAKIINNNEDIATIEFFDHPFENTRFEVEVPNNILERAQLFKQQRIYLKNQETNKWKIGRVLQDRGDGNIEAKFPNSEPDFLDQSEIYVRWNKPINDPSIFLGNKLNETRFFADKRRDYLRNFIKQRSISIGIPALISSLIDLEPHQIEVITRVLQDPVQRYLLADEVGLGKTIEAGVIIRQYVLDEPSSHKIIVITPKTIVSQWKNELAKKFSLGPQISKSIFIYGFDEISEIQNHINDVGMIVVDEAHHLKNNLDLYDILKSKINVNRMLLLSATPVLNNEDGFFDVLHLLDPLIFPIQSKKKFKEMLEIRKDLAFHTTNLIPENVFTIGNSLSYFKKTFLEDDLLQEHTDNLRKIIQTVPDENDEEYCKQINILKNHVIESYKLDKRILKNRRKNVKGLTPDRLGVEIIDVTSDSTEKLMEEIEKWRNYLYENEKNEEIKNLNSKKFFHLIEHIISRSSIKDLDKSFFEKALLVSDSEETKILKNIKFYLENFEREYFGINELDKYFSLSPKNEKFIIFCSSVRSQKMLKSQLNQESFIVETLTDENEMAFEDIISNFQNNKKIKVLICNRDAEEGLNLQGKNKTLIHYDLPLEPNRIEQRIGRLDRYGSGNLKSVVLRNNSNIYETEWINLLSSSLKIFDRSIASLQYLIEKEMSFLKKNEDSETSLYSLGIEAILLAINKFEGVDGIVERELRDISNSDTLDEMLYDIDNDYEELDELDNSEMINESDSVLREWLEKALLMKKVFLDQDKDIFQYRLSSDSLIPLNSFILRFKHAYDPSGINPRIRDIPSYPMSLNRRKAKSKIDNYPNLRLLKYGDDFLEGLNTITLEDERGRSWAVWRENEDYNPNQDADPFFRFDFIIETDVENAVEKFQREYLELTGNNLEKASIKSALKRRTDIHFKPEFISLWIDSEFNLVEDEKYLSFLDNKDMSNGRDTNINWEKWESLEKLQIDQIKLWEDTVKEANKSAVSQVRKIITKNEKTDLALKSILEQNLKRITQFKLKSQIATNSDEKKFHKKLLNLEEKIAELIDEGIRKPIVNLDSIGVVFLSNKKIENNITQNLVGSGNDVRALRKQYLAMKKKNNAN